MHKLVLAGVLATAPVIGLTAAPHEHGRSTLAVRVDGQSVLLRLAGPAGNLLGFEHRPTTAGETAALARSVDLLRNGPALFDLPAGAFCTQRSTAVSPPAFGTDGHADLDASWEFHCGSPAALTWIGARLFTAFPGLTRLATTVVAAGARKEVVLTPGTPRVLLPR